MHEMSVAFGLSAIFLLFAFKKFAPKMPGVLITVALLELERDNPKLTHILVKSSGINDLDASGVEMLSNMVPRFQDIGITLMFSGFKKQVKDVLDRTGVTNKIGRNNIFATDREALAYLNQSPS